MLFKDYINKKDKILISEAGLSRIIKKIKLEHNNFAVITAYRKINAKTKNELLNKKLRGEFNSLKMGVYPLIGHWQECQIAAIDYKDCPKDQLIDVIERSYLVIQSKNINTEDFKSLITKLTKKYDQDGSVICVDGNIKIIEKNGSVFDIGKDITLNKISQAYSQFIKKMNVPFVFESEIPSGNIGKQLFSIKGLLYPIVSIDEIKEIW